MIDLYRIAMTVKASDIASVLNRQVDDLEFVRLTTHEGLPALEAIPSTSMITPFHELRGFFFPPDGGGGRPVPGRSAVPKGTAPGTELGT